MRPPKVPALNKTKELRKKTSKSNKANKLSLSDETDHTDSSFGNLSSVISQEFKKSPLPVDRGSSNLTDRQSRGMLQCCVCIAI